jgi:hypothetical protein
MYRYLSILALITGLLMGCNNAADTTHNDSVIPSNKDSVVHAHAEHPGHASVKLDNGQKWSANAETTEGISKMKVLLESLPAESGVKDHRSLKVKLETEFNTILQKCTMKGEAHTQLHNYLLPMKEMMEKLDSDSVEERKEAANNLKQHIDAYHDHFQ